MIRSADSELDRKPSATGDRLEKQPPKNKIWKTIAKLLFSIVVLYFLFRKCDWQALLFIIKTANVPFVIAAIVAMQIAHVIAAVRWNLLCKKSSFILLLKMVFVSRLYTTILPGQLFGEAAKVFHVKRSSPNLSTQEITTSVIVDKIVGLVGLLLVGIFGVFMSNKLPSGEMAFWFAVCVLALGVCLAIPAIPVVSRLINAILDAIAKHSEKSTKLVSKLRLFLVSWQSYMRTPLVLVATVLIGVVFQAILAASMYYLGCSVSVQVPFADWCWIFAILSVALLLPISFAGLGVRETTLVGFLSIFDVSNELALSISLLALFIQIIDAAIGGVILLLDRSMLKNASLESEAEIATAEP